VKIEQGSETSVKIEKTPGEKCTRCWKTLPEVSSKNGICNRCIDVVEQKQAA